MFGDWVVEMGCLSPGWMGTVSNHPPDYSMTDKNGFAGHSRPSTCASHPPSNRSSSCEGMSTRSLVTLVWTCGEKTLLLLVRLSASSSQLLDLIRPSSFAAGQDGRYAFARLSRVRLHVS